MATALNEENRKTSLSRQQTVTTEEKKTWVTPEMAEDWLLNHNPNNYRTISESRVDNYASMMLNDQWPYNGEAIQFDWHGNLLNGQHRLKAIVQSGKAGWVLIVRGLPPETDRTFDQHRSRSIAQTLAKAFGYQYPTDTVAIVRTLAVFWRQSRPIDAIQVDVFVRTYGLTDHIYRAAQLGRHVKNFSIAGVKTIFCLCNKNYPQQVEDFCETYITGLDLKRNSPSCALRKWIESLPTTGGDIVRRLTLFRAAAAMEAQIDGKKILGPIKPSVSAFIRFSKDFGVIIDSAKLASGIE